MDNVVDIKTGRPIDTAGVNPWLSEDVPLGNVPPPTDMGPDIPDSLRAYRKDLETEPDPGPGWGTAILAGLGLNLIGFF